MWRCVTETSECTKHAGGYLDIPTSTVSLCFTYAKNEPWTKSGFLKLLKYSYLTNIEAGPLEKFVSLLQSVYTRTWLRNQAISKDHHYHPQNSPKILNWSWKSDSDFCGSFVWGAPSRTTLQPGDSKPASSLPQKAPTVGGSSIFVSGHRFMGCDTGLIWIWKWYDPCMTSYMYIYMYIYISIYLYLISISISRSRSISISISLYIYISAPGFRFGGPAPPNDVVSPFREGGTMMPSQPPYYRGRGVPWPWVGEGGPGTWNIYIYIQYI